MCACLLPSCSPQEQAFITSPSGSSALGKEHFIAADGTALPYRAWLPAAGPTAVIVALHGFNDYGKAFAKPGAFFTKRGIALYAYDQRGFGGAPHHGLWAGRENLVSDLRQFTALVASRHPRVPLYVLGESMGGAVAVVAAAGPGEDMRGLILVAPALWGGDTIGMLPRGVLWAMAHTMPYKEFTGSDLKILASDNIPMLRALGADPLVIKSTRADAIYGLSRLMDAAYEQASAVRLPVLLMYGECDQVIPRTPIEASLPRFPNAALAYYRNGYHMLLRDLQGQRVMEDIAGWIAAQSQPFAAPTPRKDRALPKPLDESTCLRLKP